MRTLEWRPHKLHHHAVRHWPRADLLHGVNRGEASQLRAERDLLERRAVPKQPSRVAFQRLDRVSSPVRGAERRLVTPESREE